jgi:hypothetical protein
LALLRTAWDKDRAFRKAEQIATPDSSKESVAQQLVIQMDESIGKAEAAWEEAQSAAMTMVDGEGDGEGSGGGRGC